jgi:hypothetical protein
VTFIAVVRVHKIVTKVGAGGIATFSFYAGGFGANEPDLRLHRRESRDWVQVNIVGNVINFVLPTQTASVDDLLADIETIKSKRVKCMVY